MIAQRPHYYLVGLLLLATCLVPAGAHELRIVQDPESRVPAGDFRCSERVWLWIHWDPKDPSPRRLFTDWVRPDGAVQHRWEGQIDPAVPDTWLWFEVIPRRWLWGDARVSGEWRTRVFLNEKPLAVKRFYFTC